MSRFPSDGVGPPEPQGLGQPTDADAHDRHGSPSRRLRSYALTRGRTRSRVPSSSLDVETLVSVTVLGEAPAILTLERRTIVQLCQRPISVAEVSAYLDVPLGVAKVLLGDMADDGLITIHQPAMPDHRPPDVPLLQRVLVGLRSL